MPTLVIENLDALRDFVGREIGVAAGDWLSIHANLRDDAYKFTNGERKSWETL